MMIIIKMNRDCQLYGMVNTLSTAVDILEEEVAGLVGTTGPTGPAGLMNNGIARLTEGTAVVSASACTPSSIVQISYLEPTINPGILAVAYISDGQFTVQSSVGTDSSYVQWSISQYPSSTIPTVSTGALTTPVAAQFRCTGDVSSNGYSSITERGFVWSHTNTLPTIDDTKEMASLGYGLGDYNHQWSDPSTVLTYVRAYATNANGTNYGGVATGSTFICLAKDTLITLADGATKPIQDILYSDLLRVWDFDRGVFSTARPLWLKCRETAPRYNRLRFDNGMELRTIDQHRIFNKEKGKFTYPMTEDTPIGTTSYGLDGEMRLIEKSVIEESVDYYNVITDYHMNLFADGVLTSCRYNNIYPIRDMRFVRDEIRLARPECDEIPSLYYRGLRLSEQLIPVSETIQYIRRLERTKQVNILFLDHQGVMYLRQHPDHKTPDDFEPACVRALNELLEKDPHLEIVVSSDWKYWISLEEMQEFYKKQGIIRAPIDYTPITPIYNWSDYPRQRANEIHSWIQQYGDYINQWTAVDDLDMHPYLQHFIKCDPIHGLSTIQIF